MADKYERAEFTREMKKDYTILLPNMLPSHFELVRQIFLQYGYKAELLACEGRGVVDEGLKYVHNDTCYPALLCIGQMIYALKHGGYDPQKTALLITQTGGGCRASNYIHLLRKALVKAGYESIPVISLNLSGLEKNSGFKLYPGMLIKGICCLLYGDLLMLLKNQVWPYEIESGAAKRLVDEWTMRLTEEFRTKGTRSALHFSDNMRKIVRDFAAIPVRQEEKVKVGIVGEIYVKYSGFANNHLEEFLHSQGCEVMVPGIMGFFEFKVDNRIEDIRLFGGNKAKYVLCKAMLRFLKRIERKMIAIVAQSNRFIPPTKYEDCKELVRGVLGYGCKMGEGWLLTSEMMELAEHGYQNIVCAQPFGCLPNHIVGKGMIRKVKELHPNANIVAIDYDPGATKVNQENRIKLMLSVAREKMQEPDAATTAVPAAPGNVSAAG